jgi:sugar phosphate isomerase/epimerase
VVTGSSRKWGRDIPLIGIMLAMPDAHARRPERLAVCSWSLRAPTPADLVAAVTATGLDRVQLALGPLVADPAWESAEATLANAGIAVVSGMLATRGEDYSTLETIARTGGIRPDATWDGNRDLARSVAAVAGRMRLDLVTFHAGFLPEDAGDPERAKLIARLREVAAIFADQGVAVGFETGQETADTLAEVLAEIDHPGVGVNFDPANMILYGQGDPVAAVRRLGPHVRQVHVKDAVPTTEPGTWGAEVAVGAGAVDWPAFLAEVRAIDPAMRLVIEREAGESRLDDVRQACRVVEEAW